MKHSFRFALAFVMLGLAPALPFAHAEEAAGTADFSHETPLMVIRFNQPHVDYAMPLYNTISSALKAKPSAVFDVVSIAPRAHAADSQSAYDKLAEKNTHKVLGTLHEIGLPAQRISLVNAIDNVETSEVRIFVH